MRNIIFTVLTVAMLSIPTVAQAGTLGCLLGAAGGGFGGAQIGSGKGQLAATALGALLGCGVGSGIQDRDQQLYQQPTYRPQPNYQRQRYYSQPRTYTGYVTPVYQPRLHQPPPTYQRPTQWEYRQPANTCPYSREYQQPITVGGRTVNGYGQACTYDGGQNWDLGPLTPAR